MMPAPTRRPHRKSRHGCQQCKKNRTKCDEKKPSCTRCSRTGAKCSLLDPASTLIIINTPSTRTSQTTRSTGRESSFASAQATAVEPSDQHSNQADARPDIISNHMLASGAELDRLRLMSHYHQFTSHTISELTIGSTEGQSIWQISVPQLAFQNDYLLHGLLSISALHAALTNPATQYLNGIAAVQHHNLGISFFTPHLSNITADNIDALFAFACLTSLYSFGIHLKGRYQLSPLVKIHEVFTLIRGSGIIVRSGQHWLQNGIWGPWFRKATDSSPEKLPKEIEAVIIKLTNRIGSTITTSTQREMYSTAIEALRRNFFQASLRPRNQMALVLLPILAPPEFLQMVCLAEPLSLAILANWAVILHWLRGSIWLSNWGLHTVKAVHDVLPPEWQDCISWALGEVEGSEIALGIQTPEDEDTAPQGLEHDDNAGLGSRSYYSQCS